MQHVHLFVCLWFSCFLHLILCLDVASICLLVCLSKVFEKVLDFLWFPFKGGEGGQGVQKGRWRDNTRKIIGPQWSIQQEGGGGGLIRRVPWWQVDMMRWIGWGRRGGGRWFWPPAVRGGSPPCKLLWTPPDRNRSICAPISQLRRETAKSDSF